MEIKERNYITEDEFSRLWNGRPFSRRESEKRQLRYFAILSLLYRHGLRRMEITRVKWSDINLASNPPTIFIKRAKGSRSGTHPLAEKEKPLLSRLKEISRGGEYVIESPKGGPITVEAINAFFRTLNAHKILPFRITPHMLRHGCGYRLVNRGVNLRVIQDYLGHSAISSTVIYTQLDANRFDGLAE